MPVAPMAENQEPANHSADDTEHDVEQKALTLTIDDFAGDEASDQPQ